MKILFPSDSIEEQAILTGWASVLDFFGGWSLLGLELIEKVMDGIGAVPDNKL